MNAELMQALADLEKEKGIKKEYMLDRIAQALGQTAERIGAIAPVARSARQFC